MRPLERLKGRSAATTTTVELSKISKPKIIKSSPVIESATKNS